MAKIGTLPPTPSSSVLALLQLQRITLIDNWRAAARQLPHAADLKVIALNDHIPELLDELITVIRFPPNAGAPLQTEPVSAKGHGLQRLHEGFSLEEVVAEYNLMRGCIHNLVEEHGVILRGEVRRIVNTVLDRAIGKAVQTYAAQQAAQTRQSRKDHLAFITHDMRTPLQGALTATELLEAEVKNNADQGRLLFCLGHMRRNIEHLSRLVEDIVKENVHVECAGGIYVDRRLVALRPLVETVIESMHTIAEKNRTLVINEISECFSVYADENLLWRVFQNLVGNAIRFTPNGAVHIAATVNDEGNKAICEVIDNGVGIPAPRLESIFNTFENDTEGRPHGLGLAFTRRLIQAHGGTMNIESEPNTKTVFRFTLPFVHSQPASTGS